jgi:hypothetical protein
MLDGVENEVLLFASWQVNTADESIGYGQHHLGRDDLCFPGKKIIYIKKFKEI